MDPRQIIADKAAQLTADLLGRVSTITTPQRRALALKGVLQQLGINRQVLAAVGGGISMERALQSAFSNYIERELRSLSGMGDIDLEQISEGVESVVGTVERIGEGVEAVGRSIMSLHRGFTPPAREEPEPKSEAKTATPVARLAPGASTALRLRQLLTSPSPTSSSSVSAGFFDRIPTWGLAVGAAGVAGLGYWLITRKKKK